MARRGWPVQAHQLALGPLGSGSPLHFHEDAVNALVYGVKRWDLLPPSKTLFSIEPPWCPPTATGSGGSDDTSSTSGGTGGSASSVCGAPPDGAVRCVQLPGDLMYVPRRWAHSTLNLVEGVAIAVESDGSACLRGGCAHVVV
jgi:histone arginine demethylase JMJD6